MPSNAIDGILEDAASNLWLATENGLSKFDQQAKTFKNYYTDEGLAANAFIDSNVYFKSDQVEMFFGGHGGITAFFPQRVIDNPYVPPIVLTDFRLFNNPVPVGENPSSGVYLLHGRPDALAPAEHLLDRVLEPQLYQPAKESLPVHVGAAGEDLE